MVDSNAVAASSNKQPDTEPVPDRTEKPKVPPILAYSDSEDDEADELHTTTSSSQTDDAPSRQAMEPAQGKTAPHDVVATVQGVGALLLSSVRAWLTPVDLLRAGAVATFHTVCPRLAATLEKLSLLATLPYPIAKALGQPNFLLPHALQQPVEFLAHLYKPVLIHQTVCAALSIRRLRKLNRIASTTTDEVFERADTERRTMSDETHLNQQTLSLPDLAVHYSTELRELKKILLDNGALLPAERFDRSSIELLRFAASCGLLKARTAHDRKLSVGEAALRILDTVKWLKTQKFMSKIEMKKWESLVRWCSNDVHGRMILLVRLGRALHVCHGVKMQHFVKAVISQVHQGCVRIVKEGGSRFDQVTVVVDCRGSNTLTITQHVALLKGVSSTLEKHYPNRLFRIYLVEVPVVLRWVLAAVMPVLQPTTRSKVRVCGMASKELPVRLAAPDLRRLSSSAGNSPVRGNSISPFFDSSLPHSPIVSTPTQAKTVKGRLSRVSFTPDVHTNQESSSRHQMRVNPMSRALSADCAYALGSNAQLGDGIREQDFSFDVKVPLREGQRDNRSHPPPGISTQTSAAPAQLLAATKKLDLSSLTPAAVKALYTSLFVMFVLLAATSQNFFEAVQQNGVSY